MDKFYSLYFFIYLRAALSLSSSSSTVSSSNLNENLLIYNFYKCFTLLPTLYTHTHTRSADRRAPINLISHSLLSFASRPPVLCASSCWTISKISSKSEKKNFTYIFLFFPFSSLLLLSSRTHRGVLSITRLK